MKKEMGTYWSGAGAARVDAPIGTRASHPAASYDQFTPNLMAGRLAGSVSGLTGAATWPASRPSGATAPPFDAHPRRELQFDKLVYRLALVGRPAGAFVRNDCASKNNTEYRSERRLAGFILTVNSRRAASQSARFRIVSSAAGRPPVRRKIL